MISRLRRWCRKRSHRFLVVLVSAVALLLVTVIVGLLLTFLRGIHLTIPSGHVTKPPTVVTINNITNFTSDDINGSVIVPNVKEDYIERPLEEYQCSVLSKWQTMYFPQNLIYSTNNSTPLNHLSLYQCPISSCQGLPPCSPEQPCCCQADLTLTLTHLLSSRHITSLFGNQTLPFSFGIDEPLSCSCQSCSKIQFELVGHVLDNLGLPVEMAAVQLDGFGLVFTEEDGLFAFRLNGSLTSVSLAVRAAGFKSLTYNVTIQPGVQRYRIFNIIMHPETTSIQQISQRSSEYSILITVDPSGQFSATILEEKLLNSSSNSLNLPRHLYRTFLSSGFAILFTFQSSQPIESIITIIETPSLMYPYTGITLGNPLHLFDSSGEQLIKQINLFKLMLLVQISGKLVPLKEVLQDDNVSYNLDFLQMLSPNKTIQLYNSYKNSYISLLPENSDSSSNGSQIAILLNSRNGRGYQKRQEISVDDSQAIITRATEPLSEYLLVGYTLPTCYVPIRTFSDTSFITETYNITLYAVILHNKQVVSVSNGVSPTCLPLPCPAEPMSTETYSVHISALHSTGLHLQEAVIQIDIISASKLLYSDAELCHQVGLSATDPSYFVYFSDPAPLTQPWAPISPPVFMDASSVKSPPFCFLGIALVYCRAGEYRVFLASHASGEISSASSGSLEEVDLVSSTDYCEEKLSFCLPFACSSDVTLLSEIWLPLAPSNTVEACRPEWNISLHEGASYNLQDGSLMLNWDSLSISESVFSSPSQLIAYIHCINSSPIDISFNCIE